MGTCFFFVQLYLSSCILTLLVGMLVKCFKVYKLQSIHDKMKKKLFWSIALRFVFESYLELVICVSIGLLNLRWSEDNFSIAYCTIFTIVFAVIVLIMPILTSIIYYWNIDRIEEETFKKRYGTLYDGLELDES